MPEEERKLLVVSQLPTFEGREVVDSEGVKYNCITIEEAIKEILEIARDLKKSI